MFYFPFQTLHSNAKKCATISKSFRISKVICWLTHELPSWHFEQLPKTLSTTLELTFSSILIWGMAGGILSYFALKKQEQGSKNVQFLKLMN